MHKPLALRAIAVSLVALAGLVTTSIASADGAGDPTPRSAAAAPRMAGPSRFASSHASASRATRLPPHGGFHGATSRVGAAR